MTRLLNTPIIGPSVAIVDSSWIDILAGLVPSGIRRMPPDFCASAGAAPRVAASIVAPRMVIGKHLLPRTPCRIPGESRDPPIGASGAAKWVPAFAGNAVESGQPAIPCNRNDGHIAFSPLTLCC